MAKSPVSGSAVTFYCSTKEKYFNTLKYCRNTLLQIKVPLSKCYVSKYK